MSTVVLDALGNELAERNVVLLHLDSKNIIGKVVFIKPGGIAVPNANSKITQTRGMIVIGMEVPIMFDPKDRVSIGALYKVVDPMQQDAVNKMMEETKRDSLPPTIL